MTSAVVLLAPDAELAQWIREELDELVRIGLLRPFYWLSSADADHEELIVERFDGELSRAPLAHQLAARHDEGVLRLVRLVLPGTEPAPVETAEARLLDLHGQVVELINLLIPTEDLEDSQREYVTASGGPTVSATQILPTWRNVVVSPEDGSPSGVTTVEADHRFVGHASAAIASISGLWIVQDGVTPVGRELQDGTGDRTLLIRTTTRSLVADRLSDRAVARALHVGAVHERIVVRDELPVPHASEALARGWVERAVKEWVVDDHAFLFADPRPPAQPQPEYLGFLGTLRLIRDFLRKKLVGAVRDEVELRIVRAQRDLEDRLEGVLLGQDARYRLALFGQRELAEGAPVSAGSMQSMQEAFIDWLQAYDSSLGSDPAADEWRGLRSLVLGFLDGGELPSSVSDKLPSDRYVVADPDVLLGPTIGPELLFPEITSLLPPVNDLLRPGDVAGLEDVIRLVRDLQVTANRALGRADETGQTPNSRGGRRRLLAASLSAVAAAVAAVVTWRTALLEQWSVSASWPPLAVPAVFASTAVIAALTAAVGWHRQRRAEGTAASVGDPSLAAPTEASTAGALPTGWPTDPGELEALLQLIEQQLQVLDDIAQRLEQSLVGRLARLLMTELAAATGRTEQFYGLIAPAPADSGDHPTRTRAVGLLRRAWRMARKPLLAAALLAAGVIALVLLPLAGVVLVGVGLTMALAWMWMITRWLVAWVRRKWLESIQLPQGESEQQFAHRAIYLVVSEVARLHRTYGTLLEWVEGLRHFVAEPLGPPAVTPDRSTAVAFRELHSHQVAAGVVGEERLKRTVAGLRKMVYFRAGWLSRAFDSLARDAEDAFVFQKNLTDRTHADADTDHQPLGSQSSPRRWLVEWIKLADHRFALRRRLIRSGFEWMAKQPPDELIDSVRAASDDQRPTAGSTFLLEAFAAPTERPFLRTQFKEFADAPPVTQRWAWVPDPLMGDAQRMLGGPRSLQMRSATVNPNALLLQTILIDAVEVRTADLATLSGGHARQLDVELLRPPAERRTGPVPRHSDDELAHLRERRIEPIDGFPPGCLISPTHTVERPTTMGEYAFRLEVDGEPLRWPIDRPIDVVVRQLGGPTNALALIRECLQRVADSSGLTFLFKGFTETFPGFNGSREADNTIWIGWVYPDEDDDGRFRTGEAIGLGGSRGFRPWGGDTVLGSGRATVLAELDYADGFGPRSVGNVLLHELGHAVNLAHVVDPQEIMTENQRLDSVVDFGPGDRYGLWLLGEGRSS